MSTPAGVLHRRASRAAALLGLAAPLIAGCGARSGPPPLDAGRHLFLTQRCGSCHALAAAHTRGGPGPDLDTSERLDLAQLRDALVEGANGMPSYADRLTPRQLDVLAAFLEQATRRP
ncbi:cytochrome c [Paraconexibacter antarcticus]|uniref:Cytochrome c n=1 Tax=Paraconexibacter antarcticus TaxID=2949664 RepID=A0ABY5DLH5_9ACTN|nr:cytochrome c [Paraconexibacter antarcticus]UTI62688.1 cytochrome c [Paraconexibacter antarcticus]